MFKVGGQRSVMVWDAICNKGVVGVVMIDESNDSKYYCNVLEDDLIIRNDNMLDENWISQQDNSVPHTFNYTKEWLDVSDIDVRDLPAMSLDLNAIANVRSVLVRNAYYGGMLFDNVFSLQEAITIAWDDIPVSYIRCLYCSTSSRLIAVVKKMGELTS